MMGEVEPRVTVFESKVMSKSASRDLYYGVTQGDQDIINKAMKQGANVNYENEVG